MTEWHATLGSSNVAGFGWQDGVLTVEFKSGDRYTATVPEATYRDLQKAPSTGSYIARHLRSRLTPE